MTIAQGIQLKLEREGITTARKAYYKFVSIDPITREETGTYLTLENPPIESLPHPIELGTILRFKLAGKGQFEPFKYIGLDLK